MIEINGYPVYGKDSSPHVTSAFFGLIGTLFFLIVFIICMIFIKPAEKIKKYKEVQIVLDTTPVPVEKKQEEKKPVQKTESVKESVSSTEHARTEPVKKETITKTKPIAKTAPINKPVTKTKAVPKKQEMKQEIKQEKKQEETPIEYALDPMEALAKQQNAKTSKKEVDWDTMFGDETEVEVSKNTSNKVIAENKISGKAGTFSDEEVKNTISVNSNNKKNTNYQTTFSKDVFEKIRNSDIGTPEVNGVSGETFINAKQDDIGKVYWEMSKGKPRALLYSTPIRLSEEAVNTIDGNKKVTIKFKVLSSGNVTDVEYIPSAILKDIVKNEIKNQLCTWRFESADYDATAQFEYNIIKK